MNKGEAQQIIDGAMFGDAGIGVQKGRKTPFPTFVYAQTGSEHNDSILGVQHALRTLGVGTSEIKQYRGNTYTTGYYTLFRSHICDYIRYLRRRWYPDGKKVVPTDLILTNLMLAQFYMDDGSSTYYRRYSCVKVRLCSCDFTFAENEFLRRQLGDLGVETTINCKPPPIISIRQRSVNKFMGIINEHILPSFKYKIKCRGIYKVKRRGIYIPGAADFKAMRKRLGKI